MIISDLFRTCLVSALAILLYFEGFSLIMVLLVEIAVNSFSSLFIPASQAIIPKVAGTVSLESANGLLQGTQAAMLSIGSAVGGVIVVVAGANWGLGINSMTYLLSAIFILQISAGYGEVITARESGKSSFLADLRVGVRYMTSHLPILEVTIGFLPVNFFGSLVEPFLVVYAVSHFGQNVAVYGYLAAAVALGIVLGSLLVGRIHAGRFAGLLMGYAILISGIAALVLALSYNLLLSILAAILSGLEIGLINTTYMSTIQAIVPDDTLARVISVDSVGSFAAIPAGLAVGGILAAEFGVNLSFMIAAAGLLVNGIAVLLMKGFRNLRYNASELRS